MRPGWLGLPWLAWAVAAALMTVLWVVVWPKARARERRGVRYLCLRWAHAVTWAVLTAAALVAGFAPQNGALAEHVGRLALLPYASFLWAFVSSAPRRA